MRSFTAFVTASVLCALSSVNADYVINPDSVNSSTRVSWCSYQQASCPFICTQYNADGSDTTTSNDCDPDALSYSCICEGNVTPNASQYTQTLPYFVCTEWVIQCVNGCGSDNDCAYDCRANHPCGAQSPKKANASVTSSSSSSASGTSSQTGGAVYTGFASSAATSASGESGSKSAATALRFGQAYGLLAVAAGLFGGFAILL